MDVENQLLRFSDRLGTREEGQHLCQNLVAKNAYLINVASYQTGINYGRWIGISGFSEGIIRYIKEFEDSSWE